jgi:alpha-glucosidase
MSPMPSQGSELGLPEAEDLPEAVLRDPTWEQSGRTERGRDGCRVPIPWSGDKPPYGFSPDRPAAPTWLPQPRSSATVTVESQTGDQASTLELYRRALRIRREHPALGDGSLRWLDAPEGVIAFARDPGFVCIVNLSAAPAPAPDGAEQLLASGPVTDLRELPPDTATWFALEGWATAAGR